MRRSRRAQVGLLGRVAPQQFWFLCSAGCQSFDKSDPNSY